MRTDLKSDLLSICRKAGRSLSGMVIADPYIPFVPDEWNGILILSEAQNLGKVFGAHVGLLRDRSPEELLLRLYPEVRQMLYPNSTAHSDALGVGPWDDGPLPFAASAVWDQQPSAFAVGNAVLWSETKSSGANATPGTARAPSIDIWREFLAILNPRIVVAVGRVAYDVLRDAGAKNLVRWLSASPRVLTILTTLGEPSELRLRFPEVKRAEALFPSVKEPSWLAYACHAVAATPSGMRSPTVSG
jgi:hypothetical protein